MTTIMTLMIILLSLMLIIILKFESFVIGLKHMTPEEMITMKGKKSFKYFSPLIIHNPMNPNMPFHLKLFYKFIMFMYYFTLLLFMITIFKILVMLDPSTIDPSQNGTMIMNTLEMNLFQYEYTDCTWKNLWTSMTLLITLYFLYIIFIKLFETIKNSTWKSTKKLTGLCILFEFFKYIYWWQ